MKKIDKKADNVDFSRLLLNWNKLANKREMPWKGEKDPYKIWLSEIILQQTRVEQGLNYYHRFIKAFPDVHQLAKAPDAKVFKLWEGLGYYTRCRNLIATARYISKELNGEFPAAYEEIKALKGIGPYTAAAISSFAFNLPYAVVDGNVFRVLSRVYGIGIPIDSAEGKKYFTRLANEKLDKVQPGVYNQAIMDFGAIVCKPALPLCGDCIFNKTCFAFTHDKISELPVKEKKITIKKRWFYYLVLEHEGKVAIQQRMQKDIWQHLYEYPMKETIKEADTKKILEQAEKSGWLQKGKYEVVAVSPLFKQQLSHQLIAGQFIQIKLKKSVNNDWLWVSKNQLKKYAFPKFINQYLDNKGMQNLF
ncbi:A/G-specific adenine glycosylase [Terrimonas pollutisoli]|uniref:A/G-specific adenine glycosylase n=1 Tax=Terrimonas pollutisoli TaxID=3034147 RepID=UPI0023ECABEC|nr:A/G-specific adenine glycosylase [Terrimonas sp. H1YJ31]